MQHSSLALLLLSLFLASDSRAQETSGTSLEQTQADSIAVSSPTLAQTQTAKSQATEEKHPRLSWIFPIYTVADSRSHIPLTSCGKWRLYIKDKTDPFTFGWVAFEAGIAQANNDLPGYGQGAAGYAKRFGSGLASEAAGGFFGTFLFPSVLHQDPRYYRLGSGPFKKRFGHALIRPILTHKDSGGRAFNWSGILGTIATSSLSNTGTEEYPDLPSPSLAFLEKRPS